MNTSERISQLEKELTELRAQERKEKEEARKKASEDKDKELTAIKNAIVAFNKKHNKHYLLIQSNNGFRPDFDPFEIFCGCII